MLAGNIERLLRGDGERLRLARAGMRFVGRYDWDESGRLVQAFLETYGADPSRYQVSAAGWPGFYEPTGADDELRVPRAGDGRRLGRTVAAKATSDQVELPELSWEADDRFSIGDTRLRTLPAGGFAAPGAMERERRRFPDRETAAWGRTIRPA